MNFRKYHIVYYLFGFLVFGMPGIPVIYVANGQQGQQDQQSQQGLQRKAGYSKEDINAEGYSTLWLETLREHPDDLADQYTPDAVRVFADGSLIEGGDTVAGWWTDADIEVDSLQVIKILEPHVDTYRYEVSRISLADGRHFKQLVIWNMEWPGPRRELEMLAEIRPVKNFREQLQARRAQWMSHCNAHMVAQLVNELYAPNALYYNHRPMITGREALVNTYQYMKNPQYELTLEPLLVEPVNDRMIFEIGQCSGSYPGKYILVWEKDDAGKWQILMDSNI